MTAAAATSYLLVHGAWHGGWCWRRVADRLIKAGHRVFAPTLTGLGERVHLRSRDNDLEQHVTDVLKVVEYEDLDDFVLCGHSYAGMIVTALLDRIPEKISSAVYVDAYLPADGQCVLDLRPAEQTRLLMERVESEGDGWLMPPTPAVKFGVRTEADRHWVDSRCVAMALASFQQPLRLTGAAPPLPRHYLLALQNDNAAFRAHYETLKNAPGVDRPQCRLRSRRDGRRARHAGRPVARRVNEVRYLPYASQRQSRHHANQKRSCPMPTRIPLTLLLTLTATIAAAQNIADYDEARLASACVASTNMGEGVCNCVAAMARTDLSDNGFMFLTAAFEKDDASAATLRQKAPVEVVPASMMMLNGPAICAQQQ